MGNVTSHLKWAEEAALATRRAEGYLRVLVEGALRLLRLSELHAPNEYSHCVECSKPWPCPTVLLTKDMADEFQQITKDDHDGGRRTA